MALDGAVVVTTPQELALIDVLKGLKMFEDMKVPSCALLWVCGVVDLCIVRMIDPVCRFVCVYVPIEPRSITQRPVLS